jgi:5-(carboxyamino)imidazole ribonucleotide mutase
VFNSDMVDSSSGARTAFTNSTPVIRCSLDACRGPDGVINGRAQKVQLPFLMPSPLVAVIMGSSSDWETMRHAAEMLDHFGVEHERHIVSAHRTPGWMAEFASGAEERGLQVIIAGAGGAAHLPGMVAAHTTLPVLGVPVQGAALQGLDSLLSIVQMPGGVPVGTLAIGKAGATNAGLLAVSILATSRPDLRARLRAFRDEQTAHVRQERLP